MLKLLTPACSLAGPSRFAQMVAVQPQMSLLTHGSYFGFSSRMKEKRIYVEKKRTLLPRNLGEAPLDFKKPWEPKARLLNVEVKRLNKRATFTRQPTPIHDYINFK